MGEGKGQEAIDHMAIDQERAFLNKKFFRDAKDPKLLAAIESMLDEHAIAINIGQLCQILRAYAAECVRAERKRCAEIARSERERVAEG